MYPGMAKTAREEGFAGDRRLVRDAGQGRALARRQVPEGARQLLMRTSREARRGGSPGRAAARPFPCATGRRRDVRRTATDADLERHPVRHRPTGCATTRTSSLVLGPDGAARRSSTAPSSSATAAGCASSSASRSRRCSRRSTRTATCGALPTATVRQVVDECFQCKLCYTQCPYTEKENHPFRLDFPRLMHARQGDAPARGRASRCASGCSADPDRLGRIGCAHRGRSPTGATRCGPHRMLMETVGGIHRDKLLPSLRRRDVRRLVRRREAVARETPDGRAHGRALRDLLRDLQQARGRARPRPRAPATTAAASPAPRCECCGMPALDAGDIALARRQGEAATSRCCCRSSSRATRWR